MNSDPPSDNQSALLTCTVRRANEGPYRISKQVCVPTIPTADFSDSKEGRSTEVGRPVRLQTGHKPCSGHY